MRDEYLYTQCLRPLEFALHPSTFVSVASAIGPHPPCTFSLCSPLGSGFSFMPRVSCRFHREFHPGALVPHRSLGCVCWLFLVLLFAQVWTAPGSKKRRSVVGWIWGWLWRQTVMPACTECQLMVSSTGRVVRNILAKGSNRYVCVFTSMADEQESSVGLKISAVVCQERVHYH